VGRPCQRGRLATDAGVRNKGNRSLRLASMPLLLENCRFCGFFTAVTINMPSSGMLLYVTIVRTGRVFLHSVRRLLVTANIVPSSNILVTLMMDTLHSYETSVLIRATSPNTPEYSILKYIYFSQ
jgi:hypothetical protein